MSGFDLASGIAGYDIPNYWPGTTKLVFPSYQFPGYPLRGYDPPGYFPVFVIAEPVVFTNELVSFLEDALGVSCYPDHLPQGDDDYPLLSFAIIDASTAMNLADRFGEDSIDVQFTSFGTGSFDTALLHKRS